MDCLAGVAGPSSSWLPRPAFVRLLAASRQGCVVKKLVAAFGGPCC